MKKRILYLGIIVFFIFSATSYAYQFSGTFKRWPSIQTKTLINTRIGTDQYLIAGDGDTINIFSATDLTYISHIRIPIKKSEGIYSLTHYSSGNKEMLYAACGGGGIHIIDISTPAGPTIDGTTPVLSSTNLTENDEANENLVSRLNAFDIAVLNDIMYVADNDYGIRIFNLSGLEASLGSPNDDDLTGYRTGEKVVRDIEVYEYGVGIGTSKKPYLVVLTTTDIAYFELIEAGRTIDSNPFFKSTVSTLAGLASLWVDDFGFTYFTDQVSKNIYIYDMNNSISQSANPKQIYPDTNERFDDLITGHPRGFFIAAPENSKTWLYLASYYSENKGTDSSSASAVDAPAGLHAIDITNNSAPSLHVDDHFELDYSSSVSVWVDNTNSTVSAYVMSTKNGINKIDIEEETGDGKENGKIFKLDELENNPKQTKLNAHDVFVAYEYAFVADGLNGSDYGFSIINVDNPFHPYFEKFVKTPGQAYSVYIDSLYTTGFVADGTAGLQILTFSSGENGGLTEPTIERSIPPPVGMSTICVAGADTKRYLLAILSDPVNTANNQLWVTRWTNDGSTPLNEMVEITKNVPNAVNVHAYSSYAFVSAGSNGAKIYKIWGNDEVLESPEEISIIDEPTYSEVVDICTGSISDNDVDQVGSQSDKSGDQYAFVADTTSVHLIAINSDASNFSPKVTKTIDISQYGAAKDIEFSDNTIYIMTDNSNYAILIYDVSDVSNPVFKDSESSFGTPSGLFVYDIVEEDPTSITGQRTIKATYLAEGTGFLSIKEVAELVEDQIDNRTNGVDMLCFMSSAEQNNKVLIVLLIIISSIISVLVIRSQKGKNH